VRDALIQHVGLLPKPLARSLTWDQGTEMSRHGEFTLATSVPVYFLEPVRSIMCRVGSGGQDRCAGPWGRSDAVQTAVNVRPRY